MARLFKSHNLNTDFKFKLLRCYIFSIVFYGVESWTTQTQLEDFERWFYRRVFRISWKYRVTNRTVMEGMRKDLEVMNTIRRKPEYLVYIMRNQSKYRLLKSVLQGKIYNKRGLGGIRRISCLKNYNGTIRYSERRRRFKSSS